MSTSGLEAKALPYYLLSVEQAPDVTRGRRLLALGEGLSDDDALKALQCVARSNADFATYWAASQQAITAAILLFDGESFAVEIMHSDNEASLLMWINQYMADHQDKALFCQDPRLLPFLHARTLHYERPFPALIKQPKRIALMECLPDLAHTALKTSTVFSTDVFRLYSQNILGANRYWLTQQAFEEAWLAGESLTLRQHSLAKLSGTGQLFLRYWVASGQISTTEYAALCRSLEAEITEASS